MASLLCSIIVDGAVGCHVQELLQSPSLDQGEKKALETLIDKLTQPQNLHQQGSQPYSV